MPPSSRPLEITAIFAGRHSDTARITVAQISRMMLVLSDQASWAARAACIAASCSAICSGLGLAPGYFSQAYSGHGGWGWKVLIPIATSPTTTSPRKNE